MGDARGPRGRPDDRLGLLTRQSVSPDVALELELIWRQTDVRATMPAVTSPTLLLARERDEAALSYLASLLPNAAVRLFPGGGESLPAVEEQAPILREIKEFIGVDVPVPDLDTVLATVLFTDIVNSTAKQASLGDRGWKGPDRAAQRRGPRLPRAVARRRARHGRRRLLRHVRRAGARDPLRTGGPCPCPGSRDRGPRGDPHGRV